MCDLGLVDRLCSVVGDVISAVGWLGSDVGFGGFVHGGFVHGCCGRVATVALLLVRVVHDYCFVVRSCCLLFL